MAKAYALLPPNMASRPADVQLLATGLQESRLRYRAQLGGGPARGLWQFERGGGVTGVLRHQATKRHALAVCEARKVAPEPRAVWAALETDDVLAAAFARLNLWWLPQALPKLGDVQGAWAQYIEAWRPGKPHPDTWPAFYAEALGTVAEEGCR